MNFTFDPLSAETIQNPYPAYSALRDLEPIHYSSLLRGWIVSRYSDVDAILRDHGRFTNSFHECDLSALQRVSLPAEENLSFLNLDPPEHTRLRTLARSAFRRHSIEALESRIRQVTISLIDEVSDPEDFDFMISIAHPLPALAIAEFLGIDDECRPRLLRWLKLSLEVERRLRSDAILRLEWYRDASGSLGNGNQMLDLFLMLASRKNSLEPILKQVIKSRRTEPKDDAISAMVHAEENGDCLSDHEVLNMVEQILGAGTGTTSNLLGNGLLALLRNPDQLEALRQDMSHVPRAVEELLRFDSPMQIDLRAVAHDCEANGISMKRGDVLYLLIGSANRDPSTYGNSAELDVTRRDTTHLSFGKGIHLCIGLSLARNAVRIALETLLDRFESIKLLEREPRFHSNLLHRGLDSLRIAARANGNSRAFRRTVAR